MKLTLDLEDKINRSDLRVNKTVTDEFGNEWIITTFYGRVSFIGYKISGLLFGNNIELLDDEARRYILENLDLNKSLDRIREEGNDALI